MADLRHVFSFDAESGTFAVRAAADLLLRGACVQATVEELNLDSVFLEVVGTDEHREERPGLGPGGSTTVRFADTEGLAMSLEAFTPDSGAAVVLRLELTNTGGEAVRVHDLQPLVLEGEAGEILLGMPSGEWTILREGWHSWDAAGVRSFADDDFSVAEAEPGCFTSSRVTMLVADEVGRGLLLGWLEEKRLTGEIVVIRHGDGASARAVAWADGVPLDPGATLATEPLMVALTAAPLDTLERYGDLFAERMESRVPALVTKARGNGNNGGAAAPALPAVSGWLSWYTRHDISDAMIRENLGHYAAEANRWKLQYWVIDDGWQSVAGDWLTVDERKFPRGMKLVADGIRSAGLRPGLWVAPFMVSEASILAREHVDWLLKDDRGEVITSFAFSEESHWRGRQFVLDVTHPGAAEYVRLVIRTIVRQWRFEYVKADFLFVAALPGVRHDPALTRTEVMRLALSILRDEAGQRFLLACGCPIGPATGLADACRTGTDVAYRWHPPEADDASPSTRNAVRNVIGRYWQHGRLFLADPDALMVREVDTELGIDEVQSLATVVAMSGGLAMWSDLVDAVSEERRKILDKVLPVWPVAARPMGLFRSELIQTLVWTLRQGDLVWRVVALVNLADRPADLPLRLSDVGCPEGEENHVFELWRETYHGATGREVVVTGVPPHGVCLLAVRPVTGGLDFLASNLHVTMDAVFCRVAPRGLSCDVTLSPDWNRRGRLFLWAPEGYVVRTLEGLLTERGDGSWSIEVDTALTTEYHFEAVHEQHL